MSDLPAEKLYPRVLRRVKGASIDGLVIPIVAIGSIVLLSDMGVESGYLKALCSFILILSVEPLAVSFTGGSIGHHVMGLRVRRISKDQNIGVLAAIIRFIVKTLVGLPAFLIVLTTKRRQALHDVVARSIVVHKNAESVPAYESLPELSRAEEQRAYASIWRRLLVIGTYWFTCYLIWVVAVASLCEHAACDGRKGVAAQFISVAFLLALVALLVLGWKGRLYGARTIEKHEHE